MNAPASEPLINTISCVCPTVPSSSTSRSCLFIAASGEMRLPPALGDAAAALLQIGDHLEVAHLAGVRGRVISSLGAHLVQLGGEHLGAAAACRHGSCALCFSASSLLLLGWQLLSIPILRAAEEDQRTPQCFGLGGACKVHLIPPPCQGQGRLPLNQVAPSPVQTWLSKEKMPMN